MADEKPTSSWPHLRGWTKVTAAIAIPAVMVVFMPQVLAVLALAGGIGGVIAVARDDEARAAANRSLDKWKEDFTTVGQDLLTLVGRARGTSPVQKAAKSRPARLGKKVFGPPARALNRLFTLKSDFNDGAAPPKKDEPPRQDPPAAPPAPKI